MNPWINTNEATNAMYREEQDATHKAAIGELTKITRDTQQSSLTKLQAENAALKEQVAEQARRISFLENLIPKYERNCRGGKV